MRVGINVLSIHEGGAVSVFGKLLEQFVRLRDDIEYRAVVHSEFPESALVQHPRIVCQRVPWIERHALGIIAWYLVGLPRWLRRERIDVLFSQTNYLPARLGWDCPSVLLEQHAGYFCPTFHLERKPSAAGKLAFALKRRWVIGSIRAADRVLVQTQALATAISERCPDAGRRVVVVPHGPGYLSGLPDVAPRTGRRGDVLRVLYVANPGVQKNFRVLFEALEELRRTESPVHLHLTVRAGDLDGRLAEGLLAATRPHVTFHGPVAPAGLSPLYEASDVFVFPSVCESFGFPLVEALAFGLPVLAADTPSNREVGGKAGRYFPAHDAHALATFLDELRRTPSLVAEASARSVARSHDFDWKVSARRTLDEIVNVAARRN